MQKIGLDAILEPGCIISTPRGLVEFKLKKLIEWFSLDDANAKPIEIWLAL